MGKPINGSTEVDGLKIHFERWGEGPPIVLAHGWGADTRSNWIESGWIDVLRQHRQVVSIDIRGHGKSDKPHALEPYSYAAMSRDVIGVMDALELDSCEFMGYSMGSFIGASLLGHQQERFSAMILGGIGDETDASASVCNIIAEALRAEDPASITDPIGRAYRRFVDANTDCDRLSLAYSALQMWPEGHPVDLAGPGIADARFPVLIVNGENDHPYVDSADEFAAALPDGQHVRIPGTDHLTTVIHADFKRVVIDFLSFS
jgi:pimeloyl-ACP methyl ester carboxylesterase